MQAQTASATSPSEIRAFMRERGFAPCDTKADIAALRALAAELISPDIAKADVLGDIQLRTGHSLFLRRRNNDPTAFIACFPLTAAGECAIRSGGFNGRAVAPDWVCPFGASVRSGYIWGLGGVSRFASFAAMRALKIMRERFFARIDLYARATTPEGRALMQGFGYLPIKVGIDPDLLRAPALLSPLPALAS
jgi:hypothetical protein